jgi:hypothetical protein
MSVFNYIIILAGAVFIGFGAVLLKGFYAKTADKRKYISFFGILDIIAGSCWALSAVFLRNAYYIPLALFAVYCALAIYGEKKYKKE